MKTSASVKLEEKIFTATLDHRTRAVSIFIDKVFVCSAVFMNGRICFAHYPLPDGMYDALDQALLITLKRKQDVTSS